MRYYTRKNVHVDRISSAWLIKRYVDSEAEFAFVEGQERIEGAVPFDMPGIELGHHGSDCTFETILKKYDLKEPGLEEMARIIHGADILTDADSTLESPGIDLAFRALRLAAESDDKAFELGFRFMDGLLGAIRERHLR